MRSLNYLSRRSLARRRINHLLRVLEKTGLRYVETVSFWGHQFSKYIIEA
jgi:hypothetical protein